MFLFLEILLQQLEKFVNNAFNEWSHEGIIMQLMEGTCQGNMGCLNVQERTRIINVKLDKQLRKYEENLGFW